MGRNKLSVQKLFEKNNLAIAFDVCYAKNEKIYPEYVSKHNSNCKKQVNILMIAKEGWHYIVKKLCIMKRHNVKTPRWFLLSKLSSFFTAKKTWISSKSMWK